MPLELDLNSPRFQKDFFALEKEKLLQVISTLRKLSQMEWQQVYKDKGLNWEYIVARDVYTLRAAQRIRISALREGNIMRLLAIHPDHDSAYE
jgi:hypothetical protein